MRDCHHLSSFTVAQSSKFPLCGISGKSIVFLAYLFVYLFILSIYVSISNSKIRSKRVFICFDIQADLEEQLRELKSQLHSLNGQLNYSESVQRDFVKLSQSLQVSVLLYIIMLHSKP